jgi:hypothetical protein
LKKGPDTLGTATADNDLGAQNIKTGLDALGTAENDSRSAKHENGT